ELVPEERMLEDLIQPPSESLLIEDISSPIAAQILDFCDDGSGGDLFAAAAAVSDPLLRSSDDVSSSSVTTPLCCYDDDASASAAAAAAAALSPFPSLDSATLSALLSPEQHPDPEPELLPSIHFPFAGPPSYTTTTIDIHHPDQFNNQIALNDAITAAAVYSNDTMLPIQMGGPPSASALTTGFDDECFAAAMVGGYMGLEAALYPGPMATNGGVVDAQAYFTTATTSTSNGMVEEVGEYQRMMECGGMVGIYAGQDNMQRVYSSGDMQVVGGGGQHMMGGCGGSSTAALPPSSEISGLDDSTFKVGRLSVEERKEKIHRYMKKRNERNFSKKIKYACRKTLADSRPRVRGRFAKNDEFCETTRPSSHNHEFDEEEEVAVKEEEGILDSSDILAHISGVNSF
ncbi:Zinc finger protein CONSTANS-LIKE 4, partial [Ananas comosus]